MYSLMVQYILEQRRLDKYIDRGVLRLHHEESPASHRHYVQLAAYGCNSSRELGSYAYKSGDAAALGA